jgi:protocatechuate 3,4-dioxygenase beta subunit
MRATGPIVIVGALALAGAALWVLAHDGATPQEPRASIARDDASAGEPAPPSLPDAPAGQARRVESLGAPAATDAALPADEPADARPAGVTGRVTRAGDGRPLAGIRVEAVLMGGTDPSGRRKVAVTDDDGNYRLEFTSGGVLARLEAAHGPDTTRTTLRPDRTLAPGEQVVVDIEVTAGVALAGNVLDADGSPVAGAEVLAWTGALHTVDIERPDLPDRIVSADAAGAFEVVAVGLPQRRGRRRRIHRRWPRQPDLR